MVEAIKIDASPAQARQLVAKIVGDPNATTADLAKADGNKWPVDAIHRIREQVRVARIHVTVMRLADQYLSDMDALREACGNRIKSISGRIDAMETMLKNGDDELTVADVVSIQKAIGDAERNLLTFMNTQVGTLSRSEFAEFVRRMKAAAAVAGDGAQEALAVEGVSSDVIHQVVNDLAIKERLKAMKEAREA